MVGYLRRDPSSACSSSVRRPAARLLRRAGLVALMLAVAIYAGLRPKASTVPMTIDIVLGFVLFWCP
jgi:hypothetical protein